MGASLSPKGKEKLPIHVYNLLVPICVLSAAHQVLRGGYEGNDCPKGLPLPSILLAPLCPWLCKRRSVPLWLRVIQMYISP